MSASEKIRKETWIILFGSVLFLSVGCGVTPLAPDTSLLPNLNTQTIFNTEKARNALSIVASTRAELAYESRQGEIACYKVFYVNSCLSKIDVLRKRKEARLREIDLISEQVIRTERAVEKNEAIAKAQAERALKEPAEALGREQSVDKVQDKLEAQSEKLNQALEKQGESVKKQAEIDASRKAKVVEIEKRNTVANSAKQVEAANRAKYQAKVAAARAKQLKAREKQKLMESKAAPAPRLPKPAKPPKVDKADSAEKSSTAPTAAGRT